MIQNCNAEQGFIIDDPRIALIWWQYLYWEKGITAKQFKKESMKDIKMMMAIKSAISEKKLREAKIRELMNNIRW